MNQHASVTLKIERMTLFQFAAALEKYNANRLHGKIDEFTPVFPVPLEKTIGPDDF